MLPLGMSPGHGRIVLKHRKDDCNGKQNGCIDAYRMVASTHTAWLHRDTGGTIAVDVSIVLYTERLPRPRGIVTLEDDRSPLSSSRMPAVEHRIVVSWNMVAASRHRMIILDHMMSHIIVYRMVAGDGYTGITHV